MIDNGNTAISSTQTDIYKSKLKYYKVLKYYKMFYKHFYKTNTFKLKKILQNFENPRKKSFKIRWNNWSKNTKRCNNTFAHNGSKVGDEVFLLAEELTTS